MAVVMRQRLTPQSLAYSIDYRADIGYRADRRHSTVPNNSLALRQPGSRHRAPRQGPRQVCRHGARAWRRSRRREDRGELGRAQRHPPDRLQAGLGPPRPRRPVPPQRRAAEPPAEGRDRVPRLRHHREPRRQGPAARHPGPSPHRPQHLAGCVVIPAARPVAFRADGVAAAPSSSRALRAALVASLRSTRSLPRTSIRGSQVCSLPLAPLRSPPASRCALPPSAPLDTPSDRRVTRPCTMLRMSASTTAPIPAQSARHCLAHSAPQCPPLTRRGGSDPPGQPASIFRSFIQHESGF